MGFLNAVADRISNVSINKDEKRLLLNLIDALDKDLVEGMYDPTERFIKASKELDDYLEEMDLASDEDEVEDEDDEFDDVEIDDEVTVDEEVIVDLPPQTQEPTS